MAPTALKHFVLIFVQNSAVKKVSILPERRVKCWPGCWRGCRSDQREENTTASSRGRRWMCKSGKYCLLMRRGNKWTQSSFIIMQVQGMHNFWVSLSISPLSANFAQDFFHIFFSVQNSRVVSSILTCHYIGREICSARGGGSLPE